MKKITFPLLLLMVTFAYTLSIGKNNIQVVEISVCEENLTMAELLAKASTSRKQLYSVSYCTCEGMNASYKSDQTIGSCKPPKNRVYSCNCIGRTDY